ncbi:MAG: M13 family peptidase [Candidatus Angelobacter sp. Gp1-AA117]|nr:MAG: M13 family peptidase [Candidatus Angelobacter sp. Gp1-AA117]
MFLKRILAVILLGVVSAAAQGAGNTGKKPAKAGSTAKPAGSKEASQSQQVMAPKSFDLNAMDKSAEPCEDFYQYACGNWRKNNPVPSDQSRWGRFNELAEYNRQVLHDILEKNSANNPKRSPIEQKIGDYYATCMDEKTVNKKGAAPLKPELNRIAAIKTKDQVIETIAYLHSLGVQALFGFGAQPDLHNASVVVAGVSQGGLGLPDRDYYISDDPKSQETRQKYQEHITKMLNLLGDDEAAAQKEAQTIMGIETKLAQAAMERVKMRDPKNLDHKMAVGQLSALAPNFQFARFFAATGAPSFSEVNVVPPNFFQQVNGVINEIPVDDWKTYLRWHALRSAAPNLSEPFVQENFEFTGRYLRGQKELQARWKRCTQETDRMLGEALGQLYVKETFGPDGKQRMLRMVNALEKALSEDIQQLEWMTPETRKQAEVKLQAITNKIGYPDKWKDYSTVKIVRGDLLGNSQRARAFGVKRDLNKIGKPLDKKEWDMTPPTVNAYYQAAENDINFPAGILQPPFFDKNVDDAVNFGGIGVVIGHELTHGFDDQGSKFDAEGNLKNWWTEADRTEFEKRTGCIADEYSSFIAVDDVHLNGRLTLGENTADNGGIRIALRALRAAMAQDAKNSANQEKDGFSPEQRFFLGFAQVWCENRTPESARLLAKTDQHSPGEYRVKGTVQNNDDFAKAFNCKPGQKMVSANACHVW